MLTGPIREQSWHQRPWRSGPAEACCGSDAAGIGDVRPGARPDIAAAGGIFGVFVNKIKLLAMLPAALLLGCLGAAFGAIIGFVLSRVFADLNSLGAFTAVLAVIAIPYTFAGIWIISQGMKAIRQSSSGLRSYEGFLWFLYVATLVFFDVSILRSEAAELLFNPYLQP